jgi:hypothetical protein
MVIGFVQDIVEQRVHVGLMNVFDRQAAAVIQAGERTDQRREVDRAFVILGLQAPGRACR